MALQKLGRSCSRFLIVWAAVLCLVFAPVGATHAQYGGTYEYGGYYSGNPFEGHLGGHYFGGGGYTDLADARLDAGAGFDLGCGSVGMFDYMKAAFNVSNIAEELQAAMKTMLAKMVMTYMMSIPVIAAAYDFLQAALDMRFSMFQQSCDLGEIRENAKRIYIDRECGKLPHGSAEYISCVEGSDATKPLKKAFMEKFGKMTSLFNQMPVDAMRPTLCNMPDHLNPNLTSCILMSYVPRFCIEGTLGETCTGGQSMRAPITMAGVSDAMLLYSDLIRHKNQNVWDDIRRANPGLTVENMEIIANKATAMAAEDLNNGSTAALPQASGNKLAMTDLSFVATNFAEGEADEMLKRYREEKLPQCVGQEKLFDPLRMTKFVAKAANDELGGAMIREPQITEGEKVNAASFFNLPTPGSPAAQKLGIDAESGTRMLEDTFGCIVNTDIHMTNPMAQVKLAQSDSIRWADYHRMLGQRVSCVAIDHIATFMLDRIQEARTKLAGPNISKGWSVETEAADGSTVQNTFDEVPTEAVKPTADATIDRLESFFKNQLAANERMCDTKANVEDVVKEFFTPTYEPYRYGPPVYFQPGY